MARTWRRAPGTWPRLAHRQLIQHHENRLLTMLMLRSYLLYDSATELFAQNLYCIHYSVAVTQHGESFTIFLRLYSEIKKSVRRLICRRRDHSKMISLLLTKEVLS